ncbi:doublesex- and mab-3-related transcription factor A2-like isoform X1 [Stylophora pistillata]|uniref:doublesex- and mab-3-related transcription factor A2-like isoform X1 n=1 Tax=Stylophora pistillata TaxID=50429 RepID=UPI000C055537|nr:doublesex- and mab-3-related transcription factor A2-like isoform X1 [Stylophora pistillata]
MGGTFLKKWIHTSKKRDPCCTLCFNHGVRSKLKGHKRLGCPFLRCDCKQCVNGRKKRVTMKMQVRLRRKQMKEIGRRNYQYIPPAAEPTRVHFSPAVVQTESPFTEEHNTINESEKTTKNGNDGLIKSVSNILHSQFGVATQYPSNCSAYFPTPCQAQWPVRDVYLGGLKYNNWRAPEQIASLSVNEPLTNPNFTVSDNSTILRGSNLYPGMESNSYRFDIRTSLEAAAVLASFAGNHVVPKL